MNLELNGRVAVISGCSVGLGRGIAKALAAEGAQTVVTARRSELLTTLQDEIEGAGGLRPMAITCDLYDRAAVTQIFNEVDAAFGPIDILMNNAGGSRPIEADAPEDVREEVWETTYALNFTAIRRLTEAFLPGMKQRRWGRILTIGGNIEPGGVNATSISKASTTLWVKSLSREVGPFGITVNSINPGRINSEQIARMYPTPESVAEMSKQIPLGYFGDPEDVAALAGFLCSPGARYITGQRIDVDGGLRLGIF